MSATMTVFLKSSVRVVGRVSAVGESVASGVHRSWGGVGRVQSLLTRRDGRERTTAMRAHCHRVQSLLTRRGDGCARSAIVTVRRREGPFPGLGVAGSAMHCCLRQHIQLLLVANELDLRYANRYHHRYSPAKQ